MTATTKARHRKATRALTPLSEVAPSARLGLAVAATSGLAIAMVGSGAAVAASTATEVGESAGSLESGIGALAASAREAVTTNEAVTVANDAKWQGSEVAEAVAEAAPTPQPQATQEKTSAQDEAASGSQAASRSESSDSEGSGRSQSEAAPTRSQSRDLPPSAAGSRIVAIASQYLGVPYVYGGSSPSGFDCSGLVQYVFKQAGISLPRTSWAQGASGTRVSAAEARPGDLVYYGHHVGIYAGNGMMIHAPKPGDVVSLVPVYDSPSYVRIA